jgi:hypothetical protein
MCSRECKTTSAYQSLEKMFAGQKKLARLKNYKNLKIEIFLCFFWLSQSKFGLILSEDRILTSRVNTFSEDWLKFSKI